MSVTFKVGDKVRVKADRSPSSKLLDGKVCTISFVCSNTTPYVHLEEEKNYRSGLFFCEVELVDESMSELEQLVKTTNEGIKAFYKIKHDHYDKIRIHFGHGGEYPNKPNRLDLDVDAYLTVKSKPVFVPFTVGNYWLVKLEGDNVHVGCQKFEALLLLKGLQDLNSGKSDVPCGAEKYKTLFATRSGVMYSSDAKYHISWEDSERIVAALQKAGVK